MKIDIEKLSEQELLDLNRKIVEKLKFLALQRTHKKMIQFSVGDKVQFHPPDHEVQKGILVKYNKKTVSVLTENGETWNVSPQFLAKIEERNDDVKPGNVMELKRKKGA